MVRVSLLILMSSLGLAACLPAPLDVAGMPCSAEHICGGDYDCNDEGFCALDPDGPGPGPGGGSDAGPDGGPSGWKNLFSNPGFEEGEPPLGWVVDGSNNVWGSDSTVKHSGARSGKATQAFAGLHMETTVPPVASQMTGFYCFSGQFRAASAWTISVELGLSEANSVSLSSSDWTNITLVEPARVGQSLSFRVDVDSFSAGALYVDTFELWHSIDVDCTR